MAQSSDTVANGSPAEIRSRIEATRAEMSGTIDAIQARLSPSRLMTDATHTVKDATIGRVKRIAGQYGNGRADGAGFDAQRLVADIKANPVPVAIVSLAATTFAAMALRRRSRRAARRRRIRESNWIRENNWIRGESASRRPRRPGGAAPRLLISGACAGLACLGVWNRSRRA